MHGAFPTAGWIALALCFGACDGADSDPAWTQRLRVPGAQWQAGALTGGDGPAITAVDVRTPVVRPGQGRVPLSGRAAGEAAAIHLGLAGSDGYFIVPTGVPDPAVPGELVWDVRFDVAVDAAEGPLPLTLRAVDAAGRAGPLRTVELTVGPAAPKGTLVVSLMWDAPADVDLYVLDPAGHRLGPDDLNTYTPPPPGAPPDAPDAWRAGGQHSGDAGADCLPDGRLAEHAVWAEAAPAGRYRAFVDLAAACGQSRVAWRMVVRRDGEAIATADGVLYPTDARRTVASGAAPLPGVDFTVP